MWGKRSDRPWSDRDRLLAAALTHYDVLTCSGCGMPKDQAWSDGRGAAWLEGYFEVNDKTICQGCAARHDHESHKKDRPDVPGMKVFVENHVTSEVLARAAQAADYKTGDQ